MIHHEKGTRGYTWFGSDHHFGHANVIKYCGRPFDSVEEMNEALIDLHNSVVRPRDRYVHVGDFSLSARYLELVPRLHGKKMLVPGNHDACWGGHNPRKVEIAKKRYVAAGFEAVWPDQVLYFDTKYIFKVSHLPYRGDSRVGGDRYVQYRPENHGHPLICGHVHDLWQTQGNQFNVGVDVNDYMPVPLDVIRDWAVTLVPEHIH